MKPSVKLLSLVVLGASAFPRPGLPADAVAPAMRAPATMQVAIAITAASAEASVDAINAPRR